MIHNVYPFPNRKLKKKPLLRCLAVKENVPKGKFLKLWQTEYDKWQVHLLLFTHDVYRFLAFLTAELSDSFISSSSNSEMYNIFKNTMNCGS